MTLYKCTVYEYTYLLTYLLYGKADARRDEEFQQFECSSSAHFYAILMILMNPQTSQMCYIIIRSYVSTKCSLMELRIEQHYYIKTVVQICCFYISANVV